MSYNLLVVESPSKADTIKGFLSDLPGDWKVMATKGHLLNLPVEEFGITFENGEFIGKWQYLEGKQKLVRQIADIAGNAEMVFIGTDDDREGEKIAFDLVDKAKLANYHRVTFNEITKPAILNAVQEKMCGIDDKKSEAQRGRRFVDRVVGYHISTLIREDFMKNNFRHKPRGVGRVICPALHILSTNERIVQSFTPMPYKQLAVDYAVDGQPFRVYEKSRRSAENNDQLNALLLMMNSTPHVVHTYKEGSRDVSPYPPLVTARLYRGAYYLYGFDPKLTERLAQDLYQAGFITYPRSDSLRISDEAIRSIITYLYEIYEDEYVLDIPRTYRNSGSAQDAHEAIRPSVFDFSHDPKSIEKHERWKQKKLNEDHLRVYQYIWYRTLSTQMTNSIYDNTQIVIQVGNVKLETRANYRTFDGWEHINGQFLKTAERDADDDWKDKEIIVPRLEVGREIIPIEVKAIDKKTKSPDRYGIGRFITTLEKAGVARPSTIGNIVHDLKEKGYIDIIKGMLKPTELGFAVDEWVNEYCDWLNDHQHAEAFESNLDSIASGDIETADELIMEYQQLVEELEELLGLSLKDLNKPSDGQKDFVKQIADDKGIDLSDDILNSKEETRKFLKKYAPKKVKIGRCPVCKTGKIHNNPKSYSCSEWKNGCKFTLWKTSAERFFERFQYEITEEELDAVMKGALGNKPVEIENLSNKEGKKFSAKIILSNDMTYGWQLGFQRFNR